MPSPRSVRTLVLPVLVLLALLLAGSARPASAASPWGWPLAPPHPVTHGFDPGPERWSPGHRGVDLAAPPGSAVRAAGAGRVSFAGPLAGRGVVVVDHGTFRTTYEPVTAYTSVGQAVRTGDVMGVLEPGHPGCPSPACLHWGLLRGDTYLDPLRLVQAGPVRLLPRMPASGGARALLPLPVPAPGVPQPGSASAPGTVPAPQTVPAPPSAPAPLSGTAPLSSPAPRDPPGLPVLAGGDRTTAQASTPTRGRGPRRVGGSAAVALSGALVLALLPRRPTSRRGARGSP